MRYWYKIFVAKHNGQLMVSFKLKIFHVIQMSLMCILCYG